MSNDTLENIGILTVGIFKRSLSKIKGAFTSLSNGVMKVLNKRSMKSMNQKTFGPLVSLPKEGWRSMKNALSQRRISKKVNFDNASIARSKNLQQNLVKPGMETIVGCWLLILAVLVFVMVCLGAYTRLVKSGHGLSPLGGFWGGFETLKKYIDYYLHRQQHRSFGFTFLEEYFSTILERIIGFVFIIPFSYFLLRGFLMPKLRNRCFGLIAMHFLQGLIGTWILNHEYALKPSLRSIHLVSIYRFFLHLNTTVLMFVVLFWNSLTLLRRPEKVTHENKENMMCARKTMPIILFIFAMNFAVGVMVAGVDGSKQFNTFPLMDGRIIPKGYLGTRPIWRDLFENVATVQFHHRLLAIGGYLAALYMFVMSRRRSLTCEAKCGFLSMFVAANIQLILGITTLLTKGFWLIGVLHQASAIMILCASLFTFHVLKNLPNQEPETTKPVEKEPLMETKKEKAD